MAGEGTLRIVMDIPELATLADIESTGGQALAALQDLLAKADQIMATQAEMAATLSGLGDTLAGIKADLDVQITALRAEVGEIQAALANPDQPVTPALQAAADKLTTTVGDLSATQHTLDTAVGDVTAVAGPPPAGP